MASLLFGSDKKRPGSPLLLLLVLHATIVGCWLGNSSGSSTIITQVESFGGVVAAPLRRRRRYCHCYCSNAGSSRTTSTSSSSTRDDFYRLRATGSRRSGKSDADDSCEKQQRQGIPQLPPIGASSMRRPNDSDGTSASQMMENDKPFVANHKFQLQYTCNICETRNSYSISRIAYRQGVVIARCKGCDSQHLIADHLGWTDYDGGFRGNQTNTIEDYFAGDQQVKVNRVSPEVFELEKILQGYNVESGAIVGDDGKLAME